MAELRKCTDCQFSLLEDNGYSNWTVMGTDFFCLIGKHPADGFDAWYNEDGRLFFGDMCEDFAEGEGIHMDVDRDDEANLSPEQRALWDAWNARLGD
jgi:hypothetical protein